MAIDPSKRCPAYDVALKALGLTRVITAARALELIDAWYVGLEDDIEGDLWDEINVAMAQFVFSVASGFLDGTLEDTIDVLGDAFIDRMEKIRQQHGLCRRKDDLADLILGGVLGQGTGKRGYKVVFSRNPS